MASEIRKKLLENEEIRIIFHKILDYLRVSSTPLEDDSPTLDVQKIDSHDEMKAKAFDTSLKSLVNLYRSLDVGDGNVKIGHWCARENENDVKGMENWSIYWLTLCDDPVHIEQDLYEQNELELTLWAVGADDNTIQKAIKVWAETHFKSWKIESLQCVRR